jgi:hypothetical protein
MNGITASRRLSVPLTESDERDLVWVRENMHILITRDLVQTNPSDAQLVRALIALGLEQLRERELAEGYAALAEDYDNAAARRIARRRRPITADDE